MSNFGNRYKASTAVGASNEEERSSVIFNFVPRPGSSLDADQTRERAEVIESLQKRVRDLNDPNHMSKVVQDGVCLYQTNETYGKAMSVEAISQVMQENDLTLRVTFKRPGSYSSSTAFELNPQMLDLLVKEEIDSHGVKMMELRVKAEAKADNPINGAMFISIEPKRSLHYFTNVDFKIDQEFDKLSYR